MSFPTLFPNDKKKSYEAIFFWNLNNIDDLDPRKLVLHLDLVSSLINNPVQLSFFLSFPKY